MITVRNSIIAVSILSIGCIILSELGENFYFVILQILLYTIIAHLIIKEN